MNWSNEGAKLVTFAMVTRGNQDPRWVANAFTIAIWRRIKNLATEHLKETLNTVSRIPTEKAKAEEGYHLVIYSSDQQDGGGHDFQIYYNERPQIRENVGSSGSYNLWTNEPVVTQFTIDK